MPDGLEILNLKEYQGKIDKLQSIGSRKRDITAIFRGGTKPLQQATKRLTRRSKSGTRGTKKSRITGRAYPGREHPPGLLRRSVGFKTSKKFKRAFYVLYRRDKRWNTYYQGFYVFKRKGYAGKPAPDMARWATRGVVFKNIDNGLIKLEKQLWEGRK